MIIKGIDYSKIMLENGRVLTLTALNKGLRLSIADGPNSLAHDICILVPNDLDIMIKEMQKLREHL